MFVRTFAVSRERVTVISIQMNIVNVSISVTCLFASIFIANAVFALVRISVVLVDFTVHHLYTRCNEFRRWTFWYKLFSYRCLKFLHDTSLKIQTCNRIQYRNIFYKFQRNLKLTLSFFAIRHRCRIMYILCNVGFGQEQLRSWATLWCKNYLLLLLRDSKCDIIIKEISLNCYESNETYWDQ